PPTRKHAIGHAARGVGWGQFLDFPRAGVRGPRSAGILPAVWRASRPPIGPPRQRRYFCRVSQCLRAFCETAGTFSKPRRGGCPHPPGWGLFLRSRTESAFTHLSFRGAPRREPAFKYLSFRAAPRREPAFKYLSIRIRFSGEEFD